MERVFVKYRGKWGCHRVVIWFLIKLRMPCRINVFWFNKTFISSISINGCVDKSSRKNIGKHSLFWSQTTSTDSDERHNACFLTIAECGSNLISVLLVVLLAWKYFNSIYQTYINEAIFYTWNRFGCPFNKFNPFRNLLTIFL